jgi:hypothetical protein
MDHHCDKVSELKKGMAAVSTDSGPTSRGVPRILPGGMHIFG